MKVLLAHPGTQHSFDLAKELERHGCLSRFWTGLAYRPDGLLGHVIGCLPNSVRSRVANRCIDGVAGRNVRSQPFNEWRALRRVRAGEDDQTVMFERNGTFQRKIPGKELANSDVTIGFDTSSWLLVERVLALDRCFVLDRSIGHPSSYQRLFPLLRRQFSDWEEEFSPRLPQLVSAEEREHRRADRIVVPSSFARATLIENGIPAEKIVVIPFGVDLDVFSPAPRSDVPRPLRFVFLGSLGARKGVPLLLRAWQSLAPRDAELWLAGPISEDRRRLIPELPGLRILGKVQHEELPALLRQCDVLVLPSYFEGLARVQLEALATGLPIIGTEATGAADLITDGVEGHIVPVGDADALRAALERFIRSADDLARMSTAARRCAERYSPEAYGARWMELLRQVA